MIEVTNYLDEQGGNPFDDWFHEIEFRAATKVTTALTRMSQGNFSNAKGVGEGVFEYRINYGPGYRLYFGKEGEKVVILLAGGTKKKQQRDIEIAHERWADYKRRKE